MKIVSIGCPKGGVGKTSLAIFIALYLVEMSKKVLVVCLDGQGDIGNALGIPNNYKGLTSDMLLTNNYDSLGIDDVFPVTGWACRASEVACNLYLLPSNYGRMADLGLVQEGTGGTDSSGDEKTNAQKRHSIMADRMKENLSKVGKGFDYVILDTPPNLGVSQYIGLYAADRSVLPIEANQKFCGEEKLSKYVKFYKGMMQRNSKLTAPIVVRNKFDMRRDLTQQYNEWAEGFFGKLLVTKRIDNCAVVDNALAAQKAPWFKPSSGNDAAKGSSIRRVVEEVVGRF